MNARWLLCFWLLVGGGSTARAVEVFLNGVQVTGAKEQVIDNAKVILDKRGDVHIQAPDYKVQENQQPAREAVAAMSPRPSPGQGLTRRYYVVNEINREGKIGLKLLVQINGRLVGTLTDDNPQLALELNPYLSLGENQVKLRATPLSAAVGAPGQWTVVIGEGKNRGTELTIDRVLSEFKLDGGQEGSKEHTFTLTAQ